MTKTYRIAEKNLANLQQEIGKLNRKGAKLGAAPTVLTLTGKTDEKEIKNDVGEVVGVTRYVEIEVSGEAPKFAGWELAAVIEHADAGNLLRKSPSCTVELTQFRDSAPTCEHCKKVRNRRDTFLVLHEAGAVKQVGADCLRDFLGHNSPHNLAQLAELHFSVHELCEEAEGNEGGSAERSLLYVKTFLAYVALARRTFGFISGKRAKEDCSGRTQSTADTALSFMFPPKGYANETPKPSDADRAFGLTTQEFIVNELDERPDLTDFQHNMLTAAKCSAVEFRSAGTVAYLVEYRCREIEKSMERQRETHFGEVGKRFRGVALTFLRSTGFDSKFGYTFVNTFSGPDGAKLTWMTSKEVDFVPGSEIKATFTVKEHSQYNGHLQTKISRLAVNQ